MNDTEIGRNRAESQRHSSARRWQRGAQRILGAFIENPVALMLVAVWVMFPLLNRMFLTGNNIITLLVANAFFAVAALGETFVLMTGGIDLSVAQNLTCSSMVSAVAMISYQRDAVNAVLNPGGKVLSLTELASTPGITSQMIESAVSGSAGGAILVGSVVAVGMGLLFGIINGAAVGMFKMSPFIVTLGTQLLARGLSYVLSNGHSISGTPRELTNMSISYGLPVTSQLVLPWVVFIMVALFLVFGLLLEKTNWGRYITLTGSNPEAARYVGIRVPLVIFSVYAIAGLLAGIGSFMSIMCLGTADPKVGDPLLLPIIGSVILGGISTSGGEGSVKKAALGILLFATIINGMTFLNLTLSFQQIILGSIIIIGMSLIARIGYRKG